MRVDDEGLALRRAPDAKTAGILFDPRQYTAFPHVARLDGDELLLAFRQAPREEIVRHTHPRSVITVMRSPDLGRTWNTEGAAQLAAGGGQEMALLYLGKGVVAGAVAWHRVVPREEAERAGIPLKGAREYAYESSSLHWAVSRDWGLSWPLCDTRRVLPGRYQPSAAPIRLSDGALLCPIYGLGPKGTACSSLVLKSADGGETWSTPVLSARGNARTRGYAEPSVVELEPGHVVALHRALNDTKDPSNRFWINESLDGGRTWTRPRNTGIISGACPRLLRLSDGRLLLTFGRRKSPFAIRAMLSDDGGATWGRTAWILRPLHTANQGYTSSIELEPGRILTVYYHDTRRGDHRRAAPRGRITGISGTFWSAP